MKKKNKVCVDLSFTLPHHGHIKLLKKAKKYGSVIVALTTDKEVIKHKGYKPELKYAERKEILESIKYVDKVIPSNWLITDQFLNKNKIDFLLHGEDNSNQIEEKKLIITKRTKNISSEIIRNRSYSIVKKRLDKK
tara:strand:- start:4752 stop:5159 length:408 start_codon:yes stop_codon:yes gene_type:complete